MFLVYVCSATTCLRGVARTCLLQHSERTTQTYVRSVRAFWLVRRELIERNPFDRVVFPKVGKPLIQTIEPEEFEQLLPTSLAVASGEDG